MWGDVIESVHLKRTCAETKFRLLFLACETLQFSMVMTNINTKCTHSNMSDMIWFNQAGGGDVCGQVMFFQLLSTKLKLVQIRHKKINSRGFYLTAKSWLNPTWRPRWWPCLVALRFSSSATTHKLIPHLVEKIKGFPLKAKSFWNTTTYHKL